MAPPGLPVPAIITITKDREVEITSRLKEGYQNGKESYQYPGKESLYLPDKEIDRRNERFIGMAE